MNPTQAQLDARLNPEKVTIYNPGNGIFKAVGDFGSTLYRWDNGKFTTLDILALGKQELLDRYGSEKDQYGNYKALQGKDAGSQATAGLEVLKNKYGIDWKSLPSVNMGDFMQQLAKNGYGSQNADGQFIMSGGPGTINDFVNVAPAQLTAQDINDKPNFLATPTNPTSGTPGATTVAAPQVSLQPGQTGDEVKKLQDYLVANGYMTQAEVDTGYGTYGPKTKSAVAKMQSALGVSAGSNAGYYGPKTISAISSGSTATPAADGYYDINGAYFIKNGESWSAVNDPNTIKGLQDGSISATKTSFSNTFGGTIAGNITPEEDAFFNSAEFKALPPDQQSAIHSIFNTVQTNDAQKKDLLTKAIEEATKNADPIFKQTLRLSIDALDRGFQDNADDLQYKEQQLTKQLERLKEDSAYAKTNLTIENQKDLKALEDELALQLGDTRQTLAASGFTDSSRRAKSEDILQKTKGNLVESSNRKFATEMRKLDNTTSRTAEDTATEIERLRKLNSSNNLNLGRATEVIVGSGNLPSNSKYTPLGGIIGTAEQKKQSDIDQATLDYYNLGFAI